MLLPKKILLYWYKKTQEFTIKNNKLATNRLFRSYRRRCINYVQARCSSDFIVIEGRKMHVDRNEYLKLLVEQDSIMTKFVKKEIKKGDTVLDLGANIGYWTCLLAELVGEKGHVYAFEPEPNNFQLLKKNLKQIPTKTYPLAIKLIQQESTLINYLNIFKKQKISTLKIRCHGDYHLGQLLITQKDLYIIDFEGEPMRSIQERRQKNSPLRDVAGMIRSFHYASCSYLFNPTKQKNISPDETLKIEQNAHYWYQQISSTFLKTYLNYSQKSSFLPHNKKIISILLNIYLLEKAIYELSYELNNRPTWVEIPIKGLLEILKQQPKQ